MAMTSTTSTRSTRRAEGHHHAYSPQGATHTTRPQQSNSSRPLKRLHDATEHGFDAIKPKRAKISIEILSKKQYQARHIPSDDSRQHHRLHQRHSSSSTTHNYPFSTKHQRQAAPVSLLPPQPFTPAHAPTEAATEQENTSSLTKHQEKVVKGIKHELDRLQPSSADMASNNQGRKLRSQEATRFKSELSAYFNEYDEVIGNVRKEEHLLNPDTPIIIVDNYPTSSSTSIPQAASSAPNHEPHSPPFTFPIRSYEDSLSTALHDTQEIDFGFLEAQYKSKILDDPLPDSHFEPLHKREVRNEKATRNIDKARAQHEKEQVVRLLDGLYGPDWLKTMGVSGITETKKKQFEPARAYFIKGCEVILGKFRKWTAEEKRQRLEKERAAKEARDSQEQEDEEDDQEQEELEIVNGDDKAESEAEEQEDGDGDVIMFHHKAASQQCNGDPPDASDVDASAIQLHEEAIARSRSAAKTTTAKRPAPPPSPPKSQKKFTSFFEKPYHRDAALHKTRRRGRVMMAWGHPIPEPPQHDFNLPEEYRDKETLKAQARRRRRDKRNHKN